MFAPMCVSGWFDLPESIALFETSVPCGGFGKGACLTVEFGGDTAVMFSGFCVISGVIFCFS